MDRVQAFLWDRIPAVIEQAQTLIKGGHHDEDIIGMVSDGTGVMAPLGSFAVACLRSTGAMDFAEMARDYGMPEIVTPPPGVFVVLVLFEGELRSGSYPIEILRVPLRPMN